MNKSKALSSREWFVSLGLTSILLLATACTFVTGGDINLKQTVEAASLQLTMMAQQSTQTALEQLNLQIAAQNATLEAQVAQLTAVATPLYSPQIPVSTQAYETPTLEAESSINLRDWSSKGWIYYTGSICNDKKEGCWKAVMKSGQVAILTGQESITLDPNWENPHLVFLTRYDGEYTLTFGFVELDIDGKPGYSRVKSFGGTKDYWHEVFISLHEFLGSTIRVRFYGEGQDKLWGADPAYKFTWLIENVQIVPNYIPK